jgi:hypothetical protein
MTHPQPEATQQPLFMVTWRQLSAQGKGYLVKELMAPPLLSFLSQSHPQQYALPRKHSPALPHPWDPADLRVGAALLLLLQYDQSLSPSEIKVWTYYLNNSNYVRYCKNFNLQHLPNISPLSWTPHVHAESLPWVGQCKDSFSLGIYYSPKKNCAVDLALVWDQLLNT